MNIDNRPIVLPPVLRGKHINSERIIPTVCNVKNMIDKLYDMNGEYSNLEQWEKRSYSNYCIEAVKTELLEADKGERINILRRHILKSDFNTLGASPFDIYIVAYVAENVGKGREVFIDFCMKNGMTGTENSANAIYQVGKGDGVYLNILNKDGTVRDWEFMRKWVGEKEPKYGVKVFNKLVRDKIPEVIANTSKGCAVDLVYGEERYKLLENKLKEEVEEFLQDKNLEELADIMEVVFGLAESLGYSEEELMKKRDEKREERGGFKEGVVLLKVYEGES